MWFSNSTPGYIYKRIEIKEIVALPNAPEILTKIWNQPKCPLMDEWKKENVIYIYIYIYIYNMNIILYIMFYIYNGGIYIILPKNKDILPF